MLRSTIRFVLGAGFAFGLCVVAQAQSVVTQPSGLNPGDPYRLVFVTSQEIQGRESAGGPSSIDGYNAFATTTANASPDLSTLGTTWSAIVSTVRPTNVNARVNTGTDGGGGVPIYNLAGQLVATDNADFWDGSIANAINVNEVGGPPVDQSNNGSGQFLVWTGTTDVGNSNNDWSLVSPTGGWMYYGHADATDGTWVGDLGGESGWDGNANTNSLMPIFAISGELTAQAATGPGGTNGVPEPASLAVWSVLGVLGLAWGVWRRRIQTWRI